MLSEEMYYNFDKPFMCFLSKGLFFYENSIYRTTLISLAITFYTDTTGSALVYINNSNAFDHADCIGGAGSYADSASDTFIGIYNIDIFSRFRIPDRSSFFISNCNNIIINDNVMDNYFFSIQNSCAGKISFRF